MRRIFGNKDYQYRKMSITNAFFGVNLPRKSRRIKNWLILAKKITHDQGLNALRTSSRLSWNFN